MLISFLALMALSIIIIVFILPQGSLAGSTALGNLFPMPRQVHIQPPINSASLLQIALFRLGPSGKTVPLSEAKYDLGRHRLNSARKRPRRFKTHKARNTPRPFSATPPFSPDRGLNQQNSQKVSKVLSIERGVTMSRSAVTRLRKSHPLCSNGAGLIISTQSWSELLTFTTRPA